MSNPRPTKVERIGGTKRSMNTLPADLGASVLEFLTIIEACARSRISKGFMKFTRLALQRVREQVILPRMQTTPASEERLLRKLAEVCPRVQSVYEAHTRASFASNKRNLTCFIDTTPAHPTQHTSAGTDLESRHGHGVPYTWRITSLLRTTWPQHLRSITLGVKAALLTELLPRPRDTFPALKIAHLDLAIYYDTIPCAALAAQWNYVDALFLKFTFMSSERLSDAQFSETPCLSRLRSLRRVHVKVFGSANPSTMPALDSLHALCMTSHCQQQQQQQQQQQHA